MGLKQVKKKIFFIIPSLRGGGAEKVTITLVDDIDFLVFDVYLIIINKVGERSNYSNDNVKIIDLKTPSIRKSFFKIFSLIKSLKPDIVYSSLNHLNLMMSFMAPFFKDIYFIARQTRKASTSFSDGLIIESITNKFMYLLNLMDIIIVQSIGMQNDLINECKIKKNKIKLINNPVDFLKIREMESEKSDFFDKHKCNLITVGRLEKSKGLERMIIAFSLLDTNKFTLTILGEGTIKSSLIDLIKKMNLVNYISFLGFQNNPYKYVSQADIFLITSYSEGFSNAVIEALACGKYVIGYSFFGDEVIIENLNGNVIGEENSSIFAQKIIEASNVSRDKNQIINSISFLDKTNILNQYYNLFNNLNN